MKSGLLFTILVLATAGLAGPPQSAKKPLSQQQVMELITGSVPSPRVAELIQENGIDFEPTEEYMASLREAGAEPVVIDALRAADAARKQAEEDAAKQKEQDIAAKAKQAIKAGNILMDVGDIDGAIKLYHESIQANPKDGEAHRMLGMALGSKKDWQGDINEQRTAILLDPSDAAAQAELKAALAAQEKGTMADLLVKALPGADVYLDDSFKGRTSAQGEFKMLELKPGAHLLRVSMQARKTFEQKINLTAGESSTVEATLPELAGTIVVHTEKGAEIFLDSARKGVADSNGTLTIPAASPGVHEVRITAANKKDFSRKVTVTPGGTARVDAALEDIPPAVGMVRTNPIDGLKYAYVPPGTFMMGCSPDERKCDDEERPSHQVTLTKGFWMSQLETNVGAYKRYAKEKQRAMPPPPIFDRDWNNDKLPIVKVSWLEAQDYCKWAGGRLPTEAEWEYAARGGTDTSLYGPVDEISWYADNSGSGHGQWGNPNVGGLKKPNAFKIYDMIGNVFEWTNDWYDSHYYKHSPKNDPQGPEEGKEKVVRGRAWVAKEDDMRVSYRDSNKPDGSYFEGGFRCVLDTLKP
jgi:formylglycine-generating enzyme required for sulfatase activity